MIELAEATSPRPVTTGSFADELYQLLLPIATMDPALGWHLLHFVSSFSLPFQVIEDVGRDWPEGPGWSLLMDVDRCPPWALGWLAQFAGVTLLSAASYDNPDLWAADMRERIKASDGRWRGGPDAIVAAARRRLTGSRWVLLNERVGDDPYTIGVLTLLSETPDPTATLADIMEQKPAGDILVYEAVAGQTYLAAAITYDTYADGEAAYATYLDAASDTP